MTEKDYSKQMAKIFAISPKADNGPFTEKEVEPGVFHATSIATGRVKMIYGKRFREAVRNMKVPPQNAHD